MNTQQDVHTAPPQVGQYQNLGNLTDRNILLSSEEEIILQTCSHQYSAPPESTPTTLEDPLATTRQPLMIPFLNTEPIICIPRIPLRWNVNNPHARVAHNYSLVDELVQSPATMSLVSLSRLVTATLITLASS